MAGGHGEKRPGRSASTQHSGKLRGREATLAQMKEREGGGTQQHPSCSHLPPWPLTAGMVLSPACTTRMAILRDWMGPAASQFPKLLPEAPKDPSMPHLIASPPLLPPLVLLLTWLLAFPPGADFLTCLSPCLLLPRRLPSRLAAHCCCSLPGLPFCSPSSLYSSLLDLTLSPSSPLSNPSSPRTPRRPPFQRKKEQTKQEIKFAFYSRVPSARGAELPKVNWEESILLPAPFPLPGLNIPPLLQKRKHQDYLPPS